MVLKKFSLKKKVVSIFTSGGDMSLVGTRPPTLDEWEKYELHHRARLAIKPGIRDKLQSACDYPRMVMKLKQQAADFIVRNTTGMMS